MEHGALATEEFAFPAIQDSVDTDATLPYAVGICGPKTVTMDAGGLSWLSTDL